MFNLLRSALILTIFAGTALADQRAQGDCMQGNYQVFTSNVPSTTLVMRSFPRCTITVFVTGSSTLATLFSDNSSTPLSNPFQSNSSGHWYFYAANGRYDVNLSGASIPAPFTLGDILLADPVSGGAGITQLTGDVTAGPGSGVQAATIPAGTITLAKMANLAANSIIGNNTGSPATPLALTISQTKTLLAIACGDLTNAAASCSTDATNASNISSGTLAVARGGSGTGSTLTGIMRGGNPFTAAELSGDATTSGSNVVTVTKINNGAFSGTNGDLVCFGAVNVPSDCGFLATNVVRKDAANTGAAAMTLNMALSTSPNAMVAPNIAGAAPTTNGARAYDTTANNTHMGSNSVDNVVALAPASALPTNGQCAVWGVTGGGVITLAGQTCTTGGTVNSGTATHLAYYAGTGTAVSDMGADFTFLTHTLTAGASAIFDMHSAATNSLFVPGGFSTGVLHVTTVTGATAGGQVTSSDVNNTIAVTGVDINTSSQVTATHITGATTNTVMKASSGNMVNSSITDNGTVVSIGEKTAINQTTPSRWLDVQVGTTANSANQIRVVGYQAALEVLNQAQTQNWYFGVDDNDSNKLKIGDGYSAGGAGQAVITIDTARYMTIGNAPFTGASLQVSTGPSAWVGGDSLVWFRHEGTAANNESLIRHEHFSNFSGTGAIPQPIITGIADRGTIASPVTLAAGDYLMIIDGRGYDGTAVSDTSAQHALVSNGTWSNTSHPSYQMFKTTPAASTTPVERMRIDSNGNIGIGCSFATAPDAPFELRQSTACAASATPTTGTLLHIVAANATSSSLLFDAYSNNPAIRGRFATGTIASPSGMVTGNNAMVFQAYGHDGTAYSSGVQWSINFTAADNWAVGDHGAKIAFFTTPNATTTITNSWTMDQDGTMLSNGIAFASLGTPTNGRFVYCTDCTIANPCAGGGTGAFAKRLNSVWVCN